MKTEIYVAHVTDYIQDLIERNLLSDAIQYIHVFELVDKFPPVSILKSYLNDSKWRVFKKEKNPHLREDDVMNKELTALRDVISCITEHHLESEYPPEDLEKRIEQLKKKADKKKFLEQQTKKKADKKCRRAVVPKPQPPQQSIPPQLPKQSAPEPQPPQHSAPEPQPSQQNAPESQLPQQSVPEPQLPNQNVLTPQRSQEIALTPQLPGESGPKSQPPQQSIFKPQPQPHSQPSQLIALKPQLSQITVIPQRPQQSIPKPQPPQQSGNKRPWTAMSAEAAPPTYFVASPTAHSIQPPLQRPVGYFINQAAPYLSMSAGHYRTPDRPYGLSGLPLGSPHSVAVNGLSRPYGPVGNLPGMGVANPNGFVHYYPRDALR
ncbi:FRIGIDA-like protein 4a [Vitis vinifera]|uniref:FRIGIDA-like protein n=1 Tax=Vitis vinifera TaxID=29760 RepID=A0A438KCW9_VITVI|nr:FRIGIDA-like protein 4a [Vitis vinifera]